MIGKMQFTKKQVASYVLMPQILPRLKHIVSASFSNLAYLIALVYRATNILPANHIYLKSQSIGQYTIQNVITEAANHLDFRFKNIDKIIVFFSMLAGLVILAAQFFLLLLMIFVNPAAAAAGGARPGLPPFGEFFTTPNPREDIVLNLLDAVFGVPNLFETGFDTRTDFHLALHSLFQIYSFGLLIVAVIILIYFIFAILAETAQTGTPFGKRYNHVWAPIRLVVGVGLLVPMAYGLNAGQWITLHAAKYGSGFATTGWILFNETLNDNYVDREELIAIPKAPEVKDLAAFMMIAHACKHAYTLIDPDIGERIDAYVVGDASVTLTAPIAIGIISYPGLLLTSHSEGQDIYIRIGVSDPEEYTNYSSSVFPHCGEIVITSTELTPQNADGGISDPTATFFINTGHYATIQNMWLGQVHDVYTTMINEAIEYVNRRNSDREFLGADPALRQEIIQRMMADNQSFIDAAGVSAVNEFEPNQDFREQGWGGAAIWYNQIANRNGALTTAAMNKPQVKRMPDVMRETCDKNRQQNKETSFLDCHDPNLSKGNPVKYKSKKAENVAKSLGDLFGYWYNANDNTGNFFIDIVNLILGTDSLFDMCQNADIHPIAQLASVGKGLIEATIRNLGISLGGGAAGIFAGFLGPAIDSVSGFFGTVAGITLLLGFVLYYVIPFLPFLYFFFAIGGWVKGLFEAMVGVPLWALGHLRIDGEGLPGDGALTGYFLVFEVFLRPILIVFGLLASVLIFAAMVTVLNDIFTLVISNMAGFNADDGADAFCGSDGRQLQQPGTIAWMRGPIDELFFTVVYGIIVYMIGMSSFKLIDRIPDNILRWMGQGIQTFNDQNTTPAEGLPSKIAVTGGVLSSQLSGAVGGFKGAAQGAAKQAKELVNPPKS